MLNSRGFILCDARIPFGSEELAWEELSDEMPAGRQVDAYHGTEVFNDGPDNYGDRVPGGVGGRVKDCDVFETYDAGDAGARIRCQ